MIELKKISKIIKFKKHNFSIYDAIIPLIVILFNVFIILFPKEVILASREGISLWFNNVLPSLLPFMVGVNILYKSGAVNFIGALLEPLMRPLFNVPGCGGVALAMGFTSGYPIGAKMVSELRKTGKINKVEAQRLISFVNNSGPLFVLGAIASSLFENMFVGYFILVAHYLSTLTIGILFRFYKKNSDTNDSSIKKYNISYKNYKNTIRSAYRDFQEKRTAENSFSSIFGQSVINSMETILHIGGFIILFCVIVRVFEIIGIFDLMRLILAPDWISSNTMTGILIGILEITNGCKNIAISGISKETVIATLTIISWGGLSIHAQSLSFISNTDINSLIYLFSKIMHAIFALLYGIILYPVFNRFAFYFMENTFIENTHSVIASTEMQRQRSLFSSFLDGMIYLGLSAVILVCGIILSNIIASFHKRKQNI